MLVKTPRATARRTASSSPDSGAAGEPSWSLPKGATLGQAYVLEADSGETPLKVLLSSGAEVEAEWALPYRYLAQPGDVLLVVGRAERHYVLNVLHGRGKSQLAIRGEGLLRAEGGQLRLKGDRGVKISGPNVTFRAQALTTLARAIHAKLDELNSRISGRSLERAGSSRRILDEDDWHSAGERTLVAADSVLFNGDLIRVS